MTLKKHMTLPDSAIHDINSLGGPPLPTGVPMPHLKIMMENLAASEAPVSSCRIAVALSARKR